MKRIAVFGDRKEVSVVHLEEIEPIGAHMMRGFGCRHRSDGTHECTLDEWEVPTYPPRAVEAVTMRRLRIDHSVTLGDLARDLGVSVVDVAALERGQKRPAAPTTWDDLFAAVRRLGAGGRSSEADEAIVDTYVREHRPPRSARPIDRKSREGGEE